MKNKLTRVIIILMVIVLSAACSAPPSGNNNSTTTSESKAGDISIGYLGGFTGDYAPWTEENFKAAQLAVEEINKSGGVLNGRMIKLINEDNHSSVEGSIQGFQKLVNINSVVSVVGTESDGIMALLKDAKNRQVPVFGHNAGTPEFDNKGGDYAFRTAPSDTLNGLVSAEILLDKGYNEIAIMVENVEGAQANAESFEKTFEEKGGKIVSTVTFNPGQNTYQGELKKIAASKPKLVYFFGGITAGTVIFKQEYQQNYGWQWVVSTELLSPDLINAIGKDVSEGMMGVVPAEDIKLESYTRFRTDFETKFGFPPGAGMYDTNAYDMIMLIALAIEAGGEASGKAVNDNIAKVANPPGVVANSFADAMKELKNGNDINYEGASGPVDFNEFGNVASSFALLEVKNGGLQQVEFFPASEFKLD
ncbi:MULTISPECIES: ABC transporter substrate-binding protein [unclassified Paenibacillus]|uniref:ABC transporter substrate-binding protein n=1 Tax=unclassified Paenibacillus TaxID=185978 RepID=UPI001AE8100C|nr:MULTISPECIES: ABC transporter substrate-binding protein [unclassified Paenibacillus]MBP1154467.1 ABC-type branched-subunit amino acid transport system substrate-binding protein [Paenibacillus sp. PvP091]MBP1170149.1 ABC-type branched-subunit amino acid transport system substrate-binding protein [Paenibacillus sp. PvR098]MBP2441177.1 ABC-type branched-subunit amino acid transport system substrate-binding protein [Paenibacillus sp. PvP052]